MRKEQIVATPAPLTLFYSYAHEDEALRDQLEKHLIQLQRQKLISEWHDRKILAGEMWEHEINRYLETAQVILLLVSPDFLASNYCYEHEMQSALERHNRGEARVIPIILRACDWQHSPLKDLQCLPRDGKPVAQWEDQDEVFHTITQGIRRIIEQQQNLAHPPSSLSSPHRQNRIRLLKQVRTIWIDGLLTQSLHHAATLELHLQDRPDVLENPWRFHVQELNQAPRTLPDGTTIVQVYDRADSELLILGEPGAGKTTLLLELTRTLLERAEIDERHRMPIVFNLASWAQERESLKIWLMEELRTRYQVPYKIGKSWVDTDQILPLLDGLDEVAKEARSACVQQINNYYQFRLERGSSPLVVCCRSGEYTSLSTHLLLQHAVSILPLSDEQVNTYLRQAREQMPELRQVLSGDAELYTLARQPLMLAIFTFAYQGGGGVGEVQNNTTNKDARYTIFTQYIEHMLKRREQSKRWKSDLIIHWLTFLAKQMQYHDQTIFSVEDLQPIWLSKKRRIIYQWCVGLICGLGAGLSIGLVAELFWLIMGSLGLLIGLAAGLIAGVMEGLNIGLETEIDPAEAIVWSWKKSRSNLVFSMVTGLLAGLVMGLFGLAIGLFSGIIPVLPILLIIGLLAGLVFGLTIGLARVQLLERISFIPNEGIWRSGRNGMRSWLLCILLAGLFCWMIFGVLAGLIGGLIIGLVSGLGFGLIGGLDAFIKHFVLRLFFWQKHNLPYNLVPFLDEMAERLLLRKVGGSYIFVHRLLMDYFADLEEKDV